MQFNYCEFAGDESLVLSTKEYSHIFKVRRVVVGAELNFCNLKDRKIYLYKIESIDKKEAILALKSFENLKESSTSKIHVGWCVVDPKIVEKHIAMLNEMGVQKISFVYSDFSQKNYVIDEKRIKRILINSCEQSGRSNLMEFEIIKSVKEFLRIYSKSVVIDFSERYLENEDKIDSFLVGPEGGFSQKERDLFKSRDIFGLKSPNILRSETAVVGICGKIIL